MHIHNLEKWYRWIYFQGRDRDANIEKTYGHRRKGRVGQTGRLGLTNIYYHFSSNHVWVWELDHKEGWAPKSWCFWAVVLEKTLESPLGSKETEPINPKENPPWIFIGRTDAEAEAPIFWPPDAKSWLTGKDSEAGKDWGQEEKRTTEDKMVEWHHRLNGHECE